jgi:hypothetical protein
MTGPVWKIAAHCAREIWTTLRTARDGANGNASPNVERLESISLLSAIRPALLNRLHAGTHLAHAEPPTYVPVNLAKPTILATQLAEAGRNARMVQTETLLEDALEATVGSPSTSVQPITTAPVTAVLAPEPLPTNFTNQPFSSAIPLFNPALGTLLSVTISHSAILQSTIVAQNLSQSSSAAITATLSGNYEIDGLNQPITNQSTTSQGPVEAGPFDPSNPDGNAIPPFNLALSDTPPATVLTQPADLAFFTASQGRTSITPTMSAAAMATANAPDGNLSVLSQTDATAAVTISFTYLPHTTTQVTGVTRFGVHQQQTVLVVSFTGPVDPTLASDPGNYEITTARGNRIGVTSATYDAQNNSVALLPAQRLNVYQSYDLTVKLPWPGAGEQTIPFGTTASLGGFLNHQNQFIAARNGHVIGH